MGECFPITNYRVRSDDPPWMTHGIKDKIENRKLIKSGHLGGKK